MDSMLRRALRVLPPATWLLLFAPASEAQEAAVCTTLPATNDTSVVAVYVRVWHAEPSRVPVRHGGTRALDDVGLAARTLGELVARTPAPRYALDSGSTFTTPSLPPYPKAGEGPLPVEWKRLLTDTSEHPRALVPEPGGRFRFTLQSDGHIRDLLLEERSLFPEFDSTFVAALDSLDRSRALAKLWANVDEPSRDYFVGLTIHPDSSSGSVPFAQVALPIFAGRRAAAVSGETAPSDSAPRRGLATRGVDGLVVLRFAVSPEGELEPSSVFVADASHRELADATVGAFSDWRFRPARIGTCKVRFSGVIPRIFEAGKAPRWWPEFP